MEMMHLIFLKKKRIEGVGYTFGSCLNN